MLLLLSLAKKLTLYCPNNKAGIVKLLLNLSVLVFASVTICVVLLGKVMFANTVSIAPPFVTFAAISMTSLTLKVVFAIGTRSKTSGLVTSLTTNVSLSVLFTLPAVSLAIIVAV